MVNGTSAGAYILFYKEYSEMPHTTGPLETSPMWHALELLQGSSPILWHTYVLLRYLFIYLLFPIHCVCLA